VKHWLGWKYNLWSHDTFQGSVPDSQGWPGDRTGSRAGIINVNGSLGAVPAGECNEALPC